MLGSAFVHTGKAAIMQFEQNFVIDCQKKKKTFLTAKIHIMPIENVNSACDYHHFGNQKLYFAIENNKYMCK